MDREEKKENERERVKRARGGDKDAVERILNDYKNLVRSFARRYILPDGETEDLVQEGMIGLYNAIGDYDESKGLSFKNFACLCVKRRIWDVMKKYNPEKRRFYSGLEPLGETDGFALDPEEEVLKNERGNELLLAMGKVLSDFEFRVFTLYIEGLTASEICKTIGKDFKSVDNAVQRSKRKLQKYLQSENS